MSASVLAPHTLEDALAALASGDPRTVIAGGTSFLAAGREIPADALSIHGLRPELRFIAAQGDRVRIGALTTLRDVVRSSVMRERAPELVAALAAAGDLAQQNRSTVGGHLASGRGRALAEAWRTIAPVLVLRGAGGHRRIAADAALGPGRLQRGDDELLVAVQGTLPPRRRPGEDAP